MKKFDAKQRLIENMMRVDKSFKQKLNETGEWSGDEDDVAWMEELRKAVDLIATETGGKLRVIDVKGFDKYQGPYAIVDIDGKNYKVWSMEEWGELWIENFPIDNTSGDGKRAGFQGTIPEIVKAINSTGSAPRNKMYGDFSLNEEEEFVPHGTYTVSNAGGYEIMLNPAGDAAKVRDAFGSDNPQTSDWLEIEFVPNDEGDDEAVIDPNGYNIPLSQVMRIQKESINENTNKNLNNGNMKKDGKERLFEVMGKLDKTFKPPLNEWNFDKKKGEGKDEEEKETKKHEESETPAEEKAEHKEEKKKWNFEKKEEKESEEHEESETPAEEKKEHEEKKELKEEDNAGKKIPVVCWDKAKHGK